MKIITNNYVYVQKKDLAFFTQTDIPILGSVFMKVFRHGNIINDDNKYEFIKFEEKKEIEYFKGLDWIIDYDLVKDLMEGEIISLCNTLIKEKDCLAHKFIAMSMSERKDNTHLKDNCVILEFKIRSLVDILLFKKGKLEIILPDGVEYPDDYYEKKVKVLKKISSYKR